MEKAVDTGFFWSAFLSEVIGTLERHLPWGSDRRKPHAEFPGCFITTIRFPSRLGVATFGKRDSSWIWLFGTISREFDDSENAFADVVRSFCRTIAIVTDIATTQTRSPRTFLFRIQSGCRLDSIVRQLSIEFIVNDP
jgi:hypothetical protein